MDGSVAVTAEDLDPEVPYGACFGLSLSASYSEYHGRRKRLVAIHM